MPTPTLPIQTLATANTFRQWLARTNTVIDLLNSNTVLISGYTVNGAFAVSKDAITSLTVANSLFINSSATFLKDNPVTISSNVTVNASATSMTISANTFSIYSPNGTFVNASAITLNASPLTTTSNVAITNASASFTVSANTLLSGPVTISNTTVFTTNTVYAKVVQISGDGVANVSLSTSSENNYNPTGLDTASVLQVQPLTTNLILTGLTAPTTLTSNTGAKVLYLYNTSGTYKITLKSANGSSDAINQFKVASDSDYDVLPGASVALLYTNYLKKWVPLSQAATGFLSLSVSGSSTLSGTLSVAANATFNANVVANTTTNTLYVDVVNNRVGVGRIPGVGFHVNTIALFDANVTTSQSLSAASVLVGANVTINTSAMLLGNTTANTLIQSTQISVANSTGSAALTPVQLTLGTMLANTTGFFAGANVSLGPTALTVGNTSANATVNSTIVTLANTSGRVNVSATSVTTGNTVVNSTTVFSNTLKVGDTTSNLAFTGNSTLTITVSGVPSTRDLAALPPTGTVVMYAGAAAPTGWLLCTGTSVARAAYPDLFTVVGTTYGNTSATTFNLPDLRSRFPMGVAGGAGTSLGNTGGSSTHSHTITVTSNGAHTHTYSGSTGTAGNHDHTFTTSTDGSHTHTVSGTTSTESTGAQLVSTGEYDAAGASHTHTFSETTSTAGSHSHSGQTTTAGSHSHTVSGTTDTDGSHSHAASSSTESSLPPYLALNYIIKT